MRSIAIISVLTQSHQDENPDSRRRGCPRQVCYCPNSYDIRRLGRIDLRLRYRARVLTLVRATWEGGILGAVGGLAGGSLGVWAASKRSHAFRQLSIPFRAFLILVPVTFGGMSTSNLKCIRQLRQCMGTYNTTSKVLTSMHSRCGDRRQLLPLIPTTTSRRLRLREQVRDSAAAA